MWRDNSQFENYLGFYVACGIIENTLGIYDAFYSHLEPGTHAAVYAIRGNRLATFFAFKSDRLGHLNRQQQVATLHQVFGQQGWQVPMLIEATGKAEHFYFDAVAQIKMPMWHQGRVMLVGDACQCLTLLAGQGASMAMTGAYLLADELHQAQGNHETAFTAYQARLKPELEERQQQARKLTGSLLAANRFSIWMTCLLTPIANNGGQPLHRMRQIEMPKHA